MKIHSYTVLTLVHKEIVGNRNGVQGLRTDEQVSGPIIPGQYFASGKFPVGNRVASWGESKGVDRVSRDQQRWRMILVLAISELHYYAQTWSVQGGNSYQIAEGRGEGHPTGTGAFLIEHSQSAAPPLGGIWVNVSFFGRRRVESTSRGETEDFLHRLPLIWMGSA